MPYAKTAADVAVDKTADIVDKAKRMLDEARGQRVEEDIVRQQSNASGFNTNSSRTRV